MEISKCIKTATDQLRRAHDDKYPPGEELSDREVINMYGSTICKAVDCTSDFYDTCTAQGCDGVVNFRCEDEVALFFGDCAARCRIPD